MKKIFIIVCLLCNTLQSFAQSTDISLNLGMAFTTSNKGITVKQNLGGSYASSLKILRCTKSGLTLGIVIDAMSLQTSVNANTTYFGNTTSGKVKGRFVYGQPCLSANALVGYRIEINRDAIGAGINAGYAYALSSGTNNTQRVYFENSKGATYGLYVNYTHYITDLLGIRAELNPRFYSLIIPSGPLSFNATLFSLPVIVGVHLKL